MESKKLSFAIVRESFRRYNKTKYNYPSEYTNDPHKKIVAFSSSEAKYFRGVG